MISRSIHATLSAAGLAVALGLAACGQKGDLRMFSTVPPARSLDAPAGTAEPRPATRARPIPTHRPAEVASRYPDPVEMEIAARPETTPSPSMRTARIALRPQARDAAPPVNVYGEMPGAARRPSEPALLDGMESLSQITFALEGGAFDPSISRDGRTIAFASTQHRATADIYVKSVTGRTVTQITADPAHDLMPAISPDGQRIAFCSNRAGSWDIYLVSASGGQAVQLTGDRSHDLHPSWSPDGSRLVFCRLGEVSGRWELWVMDVNQPVVSEFIGYGLFPAWCPVPAAGEGGREKIAFQRGRERGDRAFSIWTIDYKPGDAGSPTEIASVPGAALINPAWSPDGQRLVFAVVPEPARAGAVPDTADLWMCDVNGAGRVNLTAGRFANLMPAWGADGRIYFVSDRAGVENIWSIGTEKAILAATGAAPQATAQAHAER